MPTPSPKSPGRRPKGAPRPTPRPKTSRDHEGATEAEVGERAGSGAGYDLDPPQVPNKSGVED